MKLIVNLSNETNYLKNAMVMSDLCNFSDPKQGGYQPAQK